MFNAADTNFAGFMYIASQVGFDYSLVETAFRLNIYLFEIWKKRQGRSNIAKEFSNHSDEKMINKMKKNGNADCYEQR